MGKRITGVALVVIAICISFGAVIKFMHTFGWGSTDYKFAVIESDSMEPAIMTGALVLVQYCDISDVGAGDIVMFYAPQISSYNTHRVIEKGSDYLRTRGDNTTAPDDGVVSEDALVGKVVNVWNWAANFTGAFVRDGFHTKLILIAVLATVALTLCVIWLGVGFVVAFRWLYVTTLVLVGKAYTRPFKRKLEKDLNALTVLVNSPEPKSFFWRVRHFDTLRNIHKDLRFCYKFLDKLPDEGGD